MTAEARVAGEALVVASFYDRRPVGPLANLLDSLQAHPPGAAHALAIVVNSTGDWRLPEALAQRARHVLYRPNTGMNIGAWDAGWRAFPGYADYLFVQDECFAVDAGWLMGLTAPLRDPSVGMVGESRNDTWAKPWDALRAAADRAPPMPEHEIDGRAANRVDVYLDFMARRGIAAGDDGSHLRSLSWALRGDTLAQLDGFPVGRNYGECIAAEIAVSRLLWSRGLAVRQAAGQPFRWIRHAEWNQDLPGGPFVHAPQQRRRMEALQAELQQARRVIEQPDWGDWWRLTRRLFARAPRGRP